MDGYLEPSPQRLAHGRRRMTRECGDCSLCCKVIGVVELKKPDNEWCSNCNVGVGCKIYESRPQSCRDFACSWLLEPDVPDFMKPRSSRIVLSTTENDSSVVANVDPGMPDAWRRPKILAYLRELSSRLNVIVVNGKRAYQITPNAYFDIKQSKADGFSTYDMVQIHAPNRSTPFRQREEGYHE